MTTIIVVPCYNEAQRLDADAFVEHAQRHEDQSFLFVDDGSRDTTWNVLQAMCARLPQQLSCMQLAQNSGKAEAVRQGMLAAFARQPEIAGYWDADLATPLTAIDDLRSVFAARPPVNIVMGSRVKLLGRAIERKLARHYIGRVFATLASFVLRLPVYDTQCGAKLFRAHETTRTLFATPFRTSWVFDVEMLGRYVQLVGPAQAEATIVEFPLAAWVDVPGSKLRLHHGLKAAGDLLLIRRLYTGRAACKRRQQSVGDAAATT
jgi:glycosyltransferase involved in cell wall biosynthesis